MRLELLLPAIGVAIVVLSLSGRLSRRALAIFAIAFLAFGVGAFALLQILYPPSRTQALSMPLPLSAADTTVTSKPFTLAVTGPFDISLQLDRGDGVLSFGCLTAEPGFEALCPGRDPELDVTWTLSQAGARVASHGSDVPWWKMRRGAIDPAAARAKLAGFHAYADHAQDPSDQTPLYHALGSFDGVAGHTYALAFRVNRAAPTLARLHPRVIVGLAADFTQSIGRTYLAFALLCLAVGAFMLLRSFSRPKTAP